MRPLFIGIGCKKQQGKDTFARALKDSLRWTVDSCLGGEITELTWFAEPLKVMARMCFGLTHEQCYGSNEDKNTLTQVTWAEVARHTIVPLDRDFDSFLTAREFFQVFGTDFMRKEWPGIWALAPFRRQYNPKTRYVIIPDVRFVDEAAAIKEHGGILVEVVRPSVVSTDKHASETSLDGFNLWDVEIVNDGTLAQLALQAGKLAGELAKRHA